MCWASGPFCKTAALSRLKALLEGGLGWAWPVRCAFAAARSHHTPSCTRTGEGPVWLETSNRRGTAVDIPVRIYTWARVVLGLFLKFNWSSRTKFINLEKLLLLPRSRLYYLYGLLWRPYSRHRINSAQEMCLWLGEVQGPYVESGATDTLVDLCSLFLRCW